MGNSNTTPSSEAEQTQHHHHHHAPHSYPADPEDEEQGLFWRWDNNRGTSNFVTEMPPYYRMEKPEGSGSGIVVFTLHGMNVHSRDPFSCKTNCELSKRGLHVVAMDLAGFGRSTSDHDRGYIESWKWWIDDVVHLVEYFMSKESYQNHTFAVYGTSLGGAIAVMAGLEIQELAKNDTSSTVWKRWLGQVLICPAIAQSIEPSWAEVQILEAIHAIGGARLALGPTLSEDSYPSPEIYQIYANDPLNYKDKMRLGFAFQGRLMLQLMQPQLKNITFPFLIIHGTVDDVVPFSASQNLLEVAQTQPDLKSLIPRPDYNHFLIRNDEDSIEVYGKVQKWLNDIANLTTRTN